MTVPFSAANPDERSRGHYFPLPAHPTENGRPPSTVPSDVFPTVSADPASRTTTKSPNPKNPAGRVAGSATFSFRTLVAPGLIDTLTRGRVPSGKDLAGSGVPSAAGATLVATRSRPTVPLAGTLPAL